MPLKGKNAKNRRRERALERLELRAKKEKNVKRLENLKIVIENTKKLVVPNYKTN